MDAEEARTIGRRVKQIRYARQKSVRVIAGCCAIRSCAMCSPSWSRTRAGMRSAGSCGGMAYRAGLPV